MTPYRMSMTTAPTRRVPWHLRAFVRVVSWWTGEGAAVILAGHRAARRAIGGAWELRMYITLPGAPEWWSPADSRTSPHYRVVDREVWT